MAARILNVALLLIVSNQLCFAANQVSIGVESDLSKPTYGLHGQSSSQLSYNDQNGFKVNGALNDFLGPPIKIANGFGKMIAGSGIVGVGEKLKANGAVLGFDSKLFEAAGGADLLKGGILLGATGAKTAAATAFKGPAGKKISSIIEMPVKVVAMKDLATGKALAGMGKVKGAEALAMKAKGTKMVKEGEALKAQGLNQVLQGTNEGMQNIGNGFQQLAGNAATAVKFLPIMLDMPMQQQQILQQQQQDTKTSGRDAQSPEFQANPNNLFGGLPGLGSLIPGLGTGSQDPFTAFTQSHAHQTSPMNLFGGNHANSYAAVLNSTSPLTNLLMNPGSGILYPILNGPLGQAISGKQPGSTDLAQTGPTTGLSSAPYGVQESYVYNFIPGLTVRESSSSQMPTFGQVSGPKGVKQTEQQSTKS